MKKLLVCQHVAFEILGTLNPLFKDNGFRIRYLNFDRRPQAKPSLDGYHGLIVLGGPMNANDSSTHPHLLTEIRLIETALDREIPVLGICLGAQLIARALGAEVRRHSEKEIGWYDVSVTEEGRRDPLFSHFRRSERIFQWHEDTFDIPNGAAHLASSPGCPNQVFRYGSRVYGLQFHLEVDEPLIERWLRTPVHKKELETVKTTIDPARIRSETPTRIDRVKQLSERTFSEFVKLFGTVKKRHALASN